MGARAHLLPVLVDGRAANQRVSISFVVGAEHAAEAAERGAWKDAGKRVGLTAILRAALVGESERRSERGRRRWLLQSADLLRAVGIRTAARSKRQHCSGRHPSHLEALPQPHRQLGRRALIPGPRLEKRQPDADRRRVAEGGKRRTLRPFEGYPLQISRYPCSPASGSVKVSHVEAVGPSGLSGAGLAGPFTAAPSARCAAHCAAARRSCARAAATRRARRRRRRRRAARWCPPRAV